jgi:hypothetical protein
MRCLAVFSNQAGGRREHVEQGSRHMEISRTKTFAEPAIDRRQKAMAFCSAPLIPPKPSQITCSPQLPHPSLLFACDLQSLAVAAFRLVHPLHEQEQLSVGPINLGIKELAARLIRPGERSLQDLQPRFRCPLPAIRPCQHSIVQRPRKARLWVPSRVLQLLRIAA